MKKVLLFLCCLFVMGSLTACGQKAVDENQILNDIKTYEGFAPLNVEIDNWEIVKRQTNFDEKTDFAYCTVRASNDDYSVVRNYKMKYVLYNDGWLLENVEYYENLDCPDETVPLHGVLQEQVINDVVNIDFSQYFSFGNALSSDYSLGTIELQEGKYLKIDDDGYCRQLIQVMHEDIFFNELTNFPIEYYFTMQGDGSYGWNYQIERTKIEKSAEFNKNILGNWVHRDYYVSGEISAYGNINISSYDKDTCYVSYYYENNLGKAEYTGEVQLEIGYPRTIDYTDYSELSYVKFSLPDIWKNSYESVYLDRQKDINSLTPDSYDKQYYRE